MEEGRGGMQCRGKNKVSQIESGRKEERSRLTVGAKEELVKQINNLTTKNQTNKQIKNNQSNNTIFTSCSIVLNVNTANTSDCMGRPCSDARNSRILNWITRIRFRTKTTNCFRLVGRTPPGARSSGRRNGNTAPAVRTNRRCSVAASPCRKRSAAFSHTCN